MSEKSEACPVCGNSFLSPTEVTPSSSTEDCEVQISEYATNLLSVLEENLTLQQEHPQFHYLLALDDEPLENECRVLIVLVGDNERILTNRAKLNIQFTFSGKEATQFKNLNISSDYNVDYDLNGDTYVVFHLGDDSKRAAMLVETIFTQVYQLKELPRLYNLRAGYPHRDKDFLKSYFKQHLPMKFCFDLPQSSNMDSIKSLSKEASKTLNRWGFGEVEFDEEKRCIKGYYQPDDEPKGFFASVHHGGKLEDCEASLRRLLLQCYESFN